MTDLGGILARLEPRLGAAQGSPVPLSGGITNRNYRVRLGACDYVLRLPGKDTALLGISREAERLANQAAAELGIAPSVAAVDDRCLVTRFVHCRPIDVEQLRAAPGAVAVALRAFHDSGIELPVRFWVPELLDAYAAIVGQRGGSLPDRYGPAQALVARIADALPLTDPVPCHDDLLESNLLVVQAGTGNEVGHGADSGAGLGAGSGPRDGARTGAHDGARTGAGDGARTGAGDGVHAGARDDEAIVIVDWEYAGMGHRLFDLGNLAVNNDFDEAAQERLLMAYFGEPPTPGRRAALRLMCLVSDAREAAWGVVQSVISELDFDFDAYAARHFDRLMAAAADPDLEDWLHAASA